MNSPATVSGKLPLTAAFVLLTLAFIGKETRATAQVQPNQTTPASEKAVSTYLYGETPQPNRLNKEYVVFQRQNGKVTGAVFSPNSEFDCFTGSQKNKTLAVKSVNKSESLLGTANINLSKLHQIKTVSANEQRILSVCKQAAESQE